MRHPGKGTPASVLPREEIHTQQKRFSKIITVSLGVRIGDRFRRIGKPILGGRVGTPVIRGLSPSAQRREPRVARIQIT